MYDTKFSNSSISVGNTPFGKTSDSKPIRNHEDTSTFLSKIEIKNGSYYCKDGK